MEAQWTLTPSIGAGGTVMLVFRLKSALEIWLHFLDFRITAGLIASVSDDEGLLLLRLSDKRLLKMSWQSVIQVMTSIRSIRSLFISSVSFRKQIRSSLQHASNTSSFRRFQFFQMFNKTELDVIQSYGAGGTSSLRKSVKSRTEPL